MNPPIIINPSVLSMFKEICQWLKWKHRRWQTPQVAHTAFFPQGAEIFAARSSKDEVIILP
jgi:hypothetical protein